MLLAESPAKALGHHRCDRCTRPKCTGSAHSLHRHLWPVDDELLVQDPRWLCCTEGVEIFQVCQASLCRDKLRYTQQRVHRCQSSLANNKKLRRSDSKMHATVGSHRHVPGYFRCGLDTFSRRAISIADVASLSATTVVAFDIIDAVSDVVRVITFVEAEKSPSASSGREVDVLSRKLSNARPKAIPNGLATPLNPFQEFERPLSPSVCLSSPPPPPKARLKTMIFMLNARLRPFNFKSGNVYHHVYHCNKNALPPLLSV